MAKLVNSREREEQMVVAAGIKRPQNRVAKQGQGLSPGVGMSGLGLVLHNEECAGWGGSVTRVSPRTETSHR